MGESRVGVFSRSHGVSRLVFSSSTPKPKPDKNACGEDKSETDVADIVADAMKADWLGELQSSRSSVVDLYFAKLKECEAQRLPELNAAVCAQSYFRMFRLRGRFHVLNHSATQIQRIFRGYTARNLVKFEIRIARKQAQQKLFYERMATLIQKCFRGFISRKRKLNFYARKRYIASITVTSENLLREMHTQYEHNLATQRRMAQSRKADEFERLIGNLHHLLSTKRTNGIFKSPFGAECSATAYGISIEQHIKQKFHERFEREYYAEPRPFTQ